MLVSSDVQSSFFYEGRAPTVARSKITKKRDERTEEGDREIIESIEETVGYIAKLVLSAHPLFKSRSLQVRHARGASLIRFMCLLSDVGRPIGDFQPANTPQHPGRTYIERARDTVVEYRLTFRR